jgi:serine/threonine-protein kinase RsbW
MNLENYLCLPAEIENLPKIRGFIQESVEAYKIDQDIVSDIILAVDEVTTNIIVHGYKGARGNIEIDVRKEGNSIVVQLIDQAVPFDPTLLPAPDINLPLEQREPGGLGVYITKKLMDKVIYFRSTTGENQLILVKNVDLQKIEEET